MTDKRKQRFDELDRERRAVNAARSHAEIALKAAEQLMYNTRAAVSAYPHVRAVANRGALGDAVRAAESVVNYLSRKNDELAKEMSSILREGPGG